MPTWPLTMELLRLTPLDAWTLEQAVLGTFITGGTGGGKTSGPFQYVIRSFLRTGFGGLFLCAKPDDAGKYEELATQEGRGEDVIQFRIGEQSFNFLTYEANRGGEGQAVIQNLASLILQAAEITTRNSKSDFFDQAMQELLSHCLEVITVATGAVDLRLLLQIVQTIPQSLNQVENSETLLAMQKLAEAESKAPPERQPDIQQARDYFTFHWPTLAPETRSSISITLQTLIGNFLRYPLRDLLLGETTVTPNDVLAGKILIVDINEKRWKLISKIAGVIWKSSLQIAIEDRVSSDSLRPVFIAADEAQFWTSLSDQKFQTTARSSRGLSVYATQNLHNFYSEYGALDNSSHSRVKSLLGNLQNRFGCQNLDEETNLWYANSLGKIKVPQKSHSKSKSVTPPSPGDRSGVPRENITSGYNVAPHEEYALPPHLFTGLKRGENAQGKLVESILVSAGKRFMWSNPLKPAHQWVKLQFHREEMPNSMFTDLVRITASRQR